VAARRDFLAQIRLHDDSLAMEVADQLARYDFPAMTPIAYQLPALVHEKAGDYAGAAKLMEQARAKLGSRAATNESEYMAAYVAQMQKRAAETQ